MWWDGPARYHFVNRNMVSDIQRDLLFDFVKGLCARDREHAAFGVDVGGPGGPEMYSLGLDVHASPAHNAVVGDGNCLPFQDNSLDYITSIASIEHIPGNPVAIFQEWIRALRKGGMLVCFAPDIKAFQHNNEEEIKLEYQAPNEHTAEEWKNIVLQLHDVKIVQFNTLENNMYNIIVLVKICNTVK